MKSYLSFLISLIIVNTMFSLELIGNIYDNNDPVPFVNVLTEYDNY